MKDLTKLWRSMALRAPANDQGHSGPGSDVDDGGDDYELPDPAFADDGDGGDEDPALEDEGDELEDEPGDEVDDPKNPKKNEGQGKGTDPKAKPTDPNSKNNSEKGEQPNDKLLAEFNKALGKMTVNGKPFEGVRDLEHAKRLIQKGLTSDAEIARVRASVDADKRSSAESKDKYEKARAPYELFNKMINEGGPAVKKAFDYLKYEPKVLRSLVAAIAQWEQAKEIDPRVIDVALKDSDIAELKAQNEARSKEESSAKFNSYVEDQMAKITDLNNGVPIPADLRQLVASVWNTRKDPKTSIVAAYKHVMKTMGANPAVKKAQKAKAQDEAGRRKAAAGTGGGPSRPPAGQRKAGVKRSPDEWAAELAGSESWGGKQ